MAHQAIVAGSDRASAAMNKDIMWPCRCHDFPPALVHFLCMCRARMKRSRAAAGVFSKKHYFDNALSKDLLKLRYRPGTHSQVPSYVRTCVRASFCSPCLRLARLRAYVACQVLDVACRMLLHVARCTLHVAMRCILRTAYAPVVRGTLHAVHGRSERAGTRPRTPRSA